MTTFQDLQNFFKEKDFQMIIAAEAETLVHKKRGNKIIAKVPAGGVSMALDPIARASNAIFIGRAKTDQDREMAGDDGKFKINASEGSYILKRLFIPQEEADLYYNGFSNQSLWPLCHVAFERPIFNSEWFEKFKLVNEKFAQAIKQEINGRKTFIWINDYQLSLVPKYLNRPKNTVISLFWHIPWPTWEVFRILPPKKEILESLLMCDFLGFHRGYHVRNFLRTVERELEARTDQETNKVFFNNSVTTVDNLPMGIDTDVIKSLLEQNGHETLLTIMVKNLLNIEQGEKNHDNNKYNAFFKNNKVILGVDRLDYTKGIKLRLMAIDLFLKKNPQYKGKMVYLGIISPSREKIPAYMQYKKEVGKMANEINKKYEKDNWKPIRLIYRTFSRTDVLNFYKKANLCLVTPLDDGMNLVSKEFVIASSFSDEPGMLVLSQFAGSAIDLTSALIVNPYDVNEVAAAIKNGLEMDKNEKKARIKQMVDTLDEKNVYVWAMDFVKQAISAMQENRK